MEIKMTKQKLMNYIDACKSIGEIEEELRKASKRELVHDKVSGSNPDFPYQPQSFNIAGIMETYLSAEELERERQLLNERRQQALKIRQEVNEWMSTIPPRMQRIVECKFFHRLSWEQVAEKLGRQASGESVRKEFETFFQKK